MSDHLKAEEEEEEARNMKKKIIFGSKWLCQAKDDGWEAEELAKLSLLQKKMLIIDHEGFKNLLLKSGVIDSAFLTQLDESQHTLEGPETLRLLYDSDKENFFKNYEDALSQSVITVLDLDVATQLYDIAQENSYSGCQVNKLLTLSCQSADNFKECGNFLQRYCSEMTHQKAAHCIKKGMYIFIHVHLCY
jgi:hypothetical protein